MFKIWGMWDIRGVSCDIWLWRHKRALCYTPQTGVCGMLGYVGVGGLGLRGMFRMLWVCGMYKMKWDVGRAASR